LLDEKTRADLEQFHERLANLIIRRLVFGSPFLIAALLMTLITMLFKAGVISIRGAMKKSAQDAVAHVIDPRLLEEDAVEATKAAFAG
jgi:hypothetical protein